MKGRVYVLDSDVFIRASRQYYAFDLAPGFWLFLVRHAEAGTVRSIDWVKRELERGKDELAQWVKDNLANAFVSTDEDDVVQVYASIMNWVQAQERFTQAAKEAFAGGADGWLVAYAKARGCIVVTNEVPSPEAKSRVKLPDVCAAFGVPWAETFAMLRGLGMHL